MQYYNLLLERLLTNIILQLKQKYHFGFRFSMYKWNLHF